MVLEPYDRRSRFRAPWMIFWAALGVRVAAIVIGRTYRLPVTMDHFEYGWEVGRIARSVATGHGYANPFNGPSGPTAWLSPLYPLLVALGFKLFGVYTHAAAVFVLVCNSVFSAGTAMAVYEIAARCFDAKGIARRGARQAAPVALWSAWLWALYPAAMQYAVRWIWEMSLSTFLFTWTIVVALRLREMGEGPGLKPHFADAEFRGLKAPAPSAKYETPAPSAKYETPVSSARYETPVSSARYETPASSEERKTRDSSGNAKWILWSWLGLLWGLEALSNPSLLLCLPAMVVWVAWPELRLRRLGMRTAGGAALMAVAFAVVLAPWVVRNERVLHTFVPTRSNLGVELYVSTLDRNDVFPWGTAMPVWAGDPEFKEFVRMGEVPFARMREAEAKTRIRARPGVFARRAVDRFFFFWDDTPHPPGRRPVGEYLRRLQYSFLSLCGLMGLGLMLRRRVEGAGLFALCFVLVPIPYYLVTVQARFRHPIEPLIAILGVYLFRSTGGSLFRSTGARVRGEASHG